MDAPLYLLYFNGPSYQNGAIHFLPFRHCQVEISFHESKPENAVRDPVSQEGLVKFPWPKVTWKNMLLKSIQMSLCTLVYKIEFSIFNFQSDSLVLIH
jgi:hypothetical protein